MLVKSGEIYAWPISKYLFKEVRVLNICLNMWKSKIAFALFALSPVFVGKVGAHSFLLINHWSVFFWSNSFTGCAVWIYFASFNLCGHLQPSKVLRILHRDLLLRRRVSQVEVKLLWRKLNIFANFLKYSNIKSTTFSSLSQYFVFWRIFFSRAHLPYVAPTKYRQSSDYAAIVLGTSLLFTGRYLFCKYFYFCQKRLYFSFCIFLFMYVCFVYWNKKQN